LILVLAVIRAYKKQIEAKLPQLHGKLFVSILSPARAEANCVASCEKPLENMRSATIRARVPLGQFAVDTGGGERRIHPEGY